MHTDQQVSRLPQIVGAVELTLGAIITSLGVFLLGYWWHIRNVDDLVWNLAFGGAWLVLVGASTVTSGIAARRGWWPWYACALVPIAVVLAVTLAFDALTGVPMFTRGF